MTADGHSMTGFSICTLHAMLRGLTQDEQALEIIEELERREEMGEQPLPPPDRFNCPKCGHDEWVWAYDATINALCYVNDRGQVIDAWDCEEVEACMARSDLTCNACGVDHEESRK